MKAFITAALFSSLALATSQGALPNPAFKKSDAIPLSLNALALLASEAKDYLAMVTL